MTNNTPLIRQVGAYLKSIRNPTKHDYANHYADYLYSHLITGHPQFTVEPSTPSQLSYMAAQAVRLRLQEIFDAHVNN